MRYMKGFPAGFSSVQDLTTLRVWYACFYVFSPDLVLLFLGKVYMKSAFIRGGFLLLKLGVFVLPHV
ncbi:hypothetical protein AB669_03620 [Pedobacter sp. BMA]|nr:hypothetical protein AB669_03620 [Pedobacter sp. BMA]